MKIKNIIFDIGNVLVRWAPLEVIKSIFPEFAPENFYQKMRPIWIDLNLGKLTETQAISHYQASFDLPKGKFFQLMSELKYHQKPLPLSIELLNDLKQLDINLFSITDNIKEFMDYHRKYSAFPTYFDDIIVSADIGILKPDPRIYQYLLDKHQLKPQQSVFTDDVIANVNGAISVGINAFQFVDVKSCKQQLIELIEIRF